jgi:peptidoglycan/xylan/chitin deacetylase (PgdA/CDA1 family)
LAQALAQMKQQTGISRPRETHRMMRPEEIRAVQSELITIGSHTLEHASLIDLDSDAKAAEIVGSVGRCEALTGKRPEALAYPYGDYDAECERLAEQAGFTCACTTEPCSVGQATRPFALPRLQVGDWSSARLAAALPGAFANAA